MLARVVKKLERLEMACLKILHRLPLRMDFSDPRNSTYNLAFTKVYITGESDAEVLREGSGIKVDGTASRSNNFASF